MEIDLANKDLTEHERRELETLLSKTNKAITNDLEQIWYLMDLVWDDLDCDAKYPDESNVYAFYSHAVWLLNGLFIEQDPVSMGHRQAIATWIAKKKLTNIIDYGGGFGTLARLIADKQKEAKIDILEPHPSRFAIQTANQAQNVSVIHKPGPGYDCLVSTDVLEHVSDPLAHFSNMVDCVNPQGYLVIANAFSPMIKCHLPQSFHFRYTFNFFARMMGLELIGPLHGSHATIYKKLEDRAVNWRTIRLFEKFSKGLFPLINMAKPLLRPIRKVRRKQTGPTDSSVED